MQDTSERFQVIVDSVPTTAWQYGAPDGQPLIFVHGFRGDHHGLEGLAESITAQAPELRVIVPDLPGFGESEAAPGKVHDLDFYGEWLRGFVAALGLADGGYARASHPQL